jgi:branched-chain amino acid transport system permease protein
MKRDLFLILALLAAAGVLPWWAGDYWVGFGITLLTAIALTQSWSILSSLSGYVSLGHVVFYGLGSYVIVTTWGTLPILLSIPLAALAAAGFAFFIGLPVLRVRGPYFVILTFGLAELVKYGVVAIDAAQGKASRLILGTPDIGTLFLLMLALAALATVLAWGARVTRLGHGLRALREDEDAAATLGVPVTRYKLIAYVLSAAVPGAVGAVMALRSTYFDPIQAFDPMVSFSMITMAIIGGSDDLRGPLVGAILLGVLSETLWTHAPQLYMIILGVLLIVFVLFVPDGVCGRLARASARKP